MWGKVLHACKSFAWVVLLAISVSFAVFFAYDGVIVQFLPSVLYAIVSIVFALKVAPAEKEDKPAVDEELKKRVERLELAQLGGRRFNG